MPGFPVDHSRRATGLRREELAALAGLSVDYVVRLEQGRARHPSSQVTASLARALQLTDAERDHLFIVAGLLPPSRGEVSVHIPPGVQRLVARLGEVPLAVFTASWDLLTWSPLWAALHGEPVRTGLGRWNLLRSLFSQPALDGGDGLVVDWVAGSRDAFEASLVADLRRVHGRYPDDRGVRSLVAELLGSSERFRELWESGVVWEHQSERKVMRTVAGDIELDCDVFTVAGGDVRIVAYTAATGSEAAEKLDFLRVAAVAAVAQGH